jgi:cellulose synthase/poly-beta-1,6-N-acetylglucosamine synthase-like glycosyltransferase
MLAAAVATSSDLLLYLLYVGASLILGVVGWTTLVWMVHAWRTPEAIVADRLDDERRSAKLSFSLIVPARHEEAVLAATLSRLAGSDHPAFDVLVVVGDDDPGTRAVAEGVAGRHPGAVRVVIDHSSPKNKPRALNAALPYCTGEITGVIDAEDVVHPALLGRIDRCFQETDADVVQAGVQLMNFRSSWLTVRSVLEYYFWFRSRLHVHSRQRFVPLGGNTVFIRTDLLRAVSGWDPDCLAEDCELGVRLSSLGASTVVVHEPELVTREECPPTLAAFVRQRTRWNQGYLQTLVKGCWRRLPLRQRLLGVYILAMPYLMALASLMLPIAIATAIALKAPIMITLVSFLPALPMLAMLAVEVAGLGDFCRAYGQRASVRDYLRLVVGLPLYQGVLAFAAARAVIREARGARGWEKTDHFGLHLAGRDSVATLHPDSPPSISARQRMRCEGRLRTPAAGTRRYGPAIAVSHRFRREGLVEPSHPRLAASYHDDGAVASPQGSVALWPSPMVGTGRAAAAEVRGWVARIPVTWNADRVVQAVLLTGVGIVMATNMLHWPSTLFDEGTYVGNAWAVQHRGTLAVYTYTYGHPPLGWLLITLWTWVTGLFGQSIYSIDGGRQVMFAVAVVSCSLLYTLARRIDLSRTLSAAAVMMFALSPLGLYFHRGTELDNPATMWALAAFVLALSPRRRLWSFAASGACFAVSVLSKETTLVMLPALLLAAFQNSDHRTRRYCLTLLVTFLALIGLAYPLYATLKGELIPGPGHVSLIGTDIDMLFGRKGTGSVFDPHSVAHGTVMFWLWLDPWLVGAALVLSPIALLVRKTRAIALAYLIQVTIILRPGYLPGMYVIAPLPFAALVVAGSTQALWRFVGGDVTRPDPPSEDARWRVLGTRSVTVLRSLAVVSAISVLAAEAAVAAVYVIPRWLREDRAAVTTRQDGPERAAERWLVHHISHTQRLIVTDDFWIYLIEHGFDSDRVRGGFNSRTEVSYWPLDKDPAVRRYFPRGWREFDYIVSTDAMRATASLVPSTAQALAHSHVVATFGQGPQRIEVRAIDAAAGPG